MGSVSCIEYVMECGCDVLNKKGCARPICGHPSFIFLVISMHLHKLDVHSAEK